MSCDYCGGTGYIDRYVAIERCGECELNKLRADLADRKEVLDNLRAENAELRALADKWENLFQDEQSELIRQCKKLAATEALLVEWVAWGKWAKDNIRLRCHDDVPPMPKEKVE